MPRVYISNSFLGLFIFLFGLNSSLLSAATFTISANTNWSAIAGGPPTSADAVVVNNGANLTVDVANAVCVSLTIGNAGGNGTITFNSGSQVTVSGATATGNGTQTGTIDMTNGGKLISNSLTGSSTATFTYGTGTVELKTTNTLPNFATFASFYNLTINGGTTTLSRAITVNMNLAINSGELKCNQFAITGNATGTMTMAASTTLRLGLANNATSVPFPSNYTKANISLNATSTVIYSNRATESISVTPDYGSLTIDYLGTGASTITKTFSSTPLTVNGSFSTIASNGTLNVNLNTITANITGDCTADAETGTACNLNITTGILNIDGTFYLNINSAVSFTTGSFYVGGAMVIDGSATFTVGSSTIKYDGTSDQTVQPFSYYNLTIDKSSGTATLSSDASVSNLLTMTNGTFLISGTTTNLTGAGGVTATGGDLQIQSTGVTVPELTGTYSVSSSSTITFNGAGAQTIRSNSVSSPTTKYYNVVFGSSGTKTLQGNLDVDGTLTISGTAQLDVSASNLQVNVGDDWTITSTNADPFVQRSGAVIFDGATAQVISTVLSGGESFYNLTISNSSGDVTLSSNVSFSNTLAFTSGHLILGNYNLYSGATGLSISGYTSSRYLVTNGTGVFDVQNMVDPVDIPIGTSTTSYTPLNVDATAGDPVELTFRVINGVYQNGTTGTALTTDVVNKTWLISEIGGTGAGIVDVTFQWNGTDQLSGFTNNVSCGVSHYNSGTSTWDTPTYAAASGTDPYTRTRTGITSFSPFAVERSTHPLPIELLSFRSTLTKEHEVEVQWTTATEKNNNYFTIERSRDGISFEDVLTVEGAGNSSRISEYTATDRKPYSGTSYYRLKQTDYDGLCSYSDLRTVLNDDIIVIYPVPATDRLYVYPNDEDAGSYKYWEIRDEKGSLVLFGREEQGQGRGILTIERLIPGMYLLSFPCETGCKPLKFIKE